MNILFLSYGRFEYDGRQRELIKVCKQLGKTYYLTCAGEDYVPAEPEHILTKWGVGYYFTDKD